MAKNEKIPYFCRVVLQNFPFIEEDFDALTTYQLISKVVEFLNKVIKSQNTLVDNVNNLSLAFQQLHDYVENYFKNLDVQEEINNKLDQMAEDGTLQEIITAYIQANTAWCFNTLSDLKTAENLIDGSFAQTLGYRTMNDGGKAFYKIREVNNTDVVDEAYIVALSNENLIAELVIPDNITPEMMGAYGDGVHDDSSYFDKAKVANRTILLSKNYKLDNYTAENMHFKFKNCEFTGEITFNNCTIEGEALLTDNFNLVSNNIINIKEIEVRSGRTIKYISGDHNLIENVNFIASNNSSTSPCIYVGGNDNTIKNCTFPNGYWLGIRVGGNNTLISNCLFKNQTQAGINYSGVKISTDEYTSNFPDNTIIENCVFYGSQGDNIDTFLGGTHITIKNNIFHSNYGQTLECKSYDFEREEGYNTYNTVTDTLIFEGNIVYGYCIFNCEFGVSSDYTVYPRNIIVRNNTFYQNNALQYSVIMASPNAIIEGNKFFCGSNSASAVRLAGDVVDNTIIRNNIINGGRLLTAETTNNTKVLLKANYFNGYLVYSGTTKTIFESQDNYFETGTTAFTGGNIISDGDTFKATTGLVSAAGNADYFIIKNVVIKSSPAAQFRAMTYTVGNLLVDGVSSASIVSSGTFTTSDTTGVTVIAGI